MTTTPQQQKLLRLLSDLFQMDRADLDFGIYRVMNQRRDEITAFLENDLLPQVRDALGTATDGDAAALKAEMESKRRELITDGIEPAQSRLFRDLEARYNAAGNPEALEAEVFAHLHTFFSRYYDKGDFISKRRYSRDGKYAIPYDGEEVKLVWANMDQYYIKTTENFRDYAFTTDAGTVHFRIADAEEQTGNNKPAGEKALRFVLREAEPVVVEGGDLSIRFEYKAMPKGTKQEDQNAAAVKTICEAAPPAWTAAMSAKAPTKANESRTLLEKHLTDYTTRNTSDYFIHKDLGGFLRRELDFYIKNEVMRLDDIENANAPKVESYLRQIRAIRAVAGKIITFLAQLEDFQKGLWLKKKFVVRTDWLVTLDKVPESLYETIAANDAQREEWVRLFAIDKIQESTTGVAYSNPLTVAFLKDNPFLLVDTAFFDNVFKEDLLAAFDNLDEQTNGLLIHSENFQALNLIRERYREQVKCVYIDPPYNTSSSGILYKNDYRHSAWATMMFDRVGALHSLLPRDGAIFVSIDKTERTVLEFLMDAVFGEQNRVEELIWSMNTNNSQSPNYSTNHEYVLVYAADRATAEQDRDMFREPKPGFEEVMDLIGRLNPTFPEVPQIEADLRALYDLHKVEYREEIEAQGLEWEDEKNNDPWKGLFNYNRAEYRDAHGDLVPEREAKTREARIWVWQEDNTSMPATKQAASTADPDHPNWRFYRPLHPVTGRPCPHPKSGWKFAYADDEDSPDKRSFVALDRDNRIAWGLDEKKVPRLKRMLHEVETNVGKSVFQDYSDGEKQTSAMFGKSGVFLAPKHADFVARFVRHAAKPDSTIVDCFGGSGSTAHAVLTLNRHDRGRRKFVLVEVGTHFDGVLKPRIAKTLYSKDWKGGKPVSREGVSQVVKVLRLESYEDTLNNLAFAERTPEQVELLENDAAREDFLLRYTMDVETRASRLDIAQFDHPFHYTLQIASGTVGETKETVVDLPETFNFLLGLRVTWRKRLRNILCIEGMNPDGEKVLVLWRDVKETDNNALNDFLDTVRINTRDAEYARIYVNGDNNLQNVRREDETWKVVLVEEEFQRRMFDGTGL